MASETLAPDALLLQTNLSGTVGAIDEPVDNDDAIWLSALSDNSAGQCVVSFPTPSGLLNPGAGLQQFRARVRLTTNQSPIAYRMYLRESGVRLNGGTPIASGTITGNQIISGIWNASMLSGLVGTNVEFDLEMDRQAGNPSVRTAGEVGAVEWVADYAEVGIPPFSAETGAFTTVGGAATLKATRRMTAEPGVFTTVGNPIAALRQYTMVVDEIDVAFFGYAGAEANFYHNRKMIADGASFTLSGGAANFKYTSNVDAETGAFTLTGNAANLRKASKLNAETGVFKLGSPGAGLYTGANITMTADPGAFTATGGAADFKVSTIPDPLEFTVDGGEATLTAQRRIYAEPGVFSLTGSAAAVGRSFSIAAETGSFTLDGEEVTFLVDKDFVAEPGAFALAGGNANLYWSGPIHAGPDDQDIQIVVVS